MTPTTRRRIARAIALLKAENPGADVAVVVDAKGANWSLRVTHPAPVKRA
jgi:hypothetical protein